MKNLYRGIKRMLALLLSAIMLAQMIPAEAFAEIEGYKVWVGGYQVTSVNKNNIPGVEGGTAQYDPVERILTFNNVTGINGYKRGDMYNTENKHMIYFSEENLSIRGNLKINNEDSSIFSCIYGQYSFDINGDIEITSNSNHTIYGYRDINIGGNLKLTNTSTGSARVVLGSTINVYGGKHSFISKGEHYPSAGISARNFQMSAGEVTAETVYGAALDADEGLIMNGGKLQLRAMSDVPAINGNQMFLTNKMSMNGGEIIAESLEAHTAIIFDDGITLDPTIEIYEPVSGKLETGKTYFVDIEGIKARKVHLRKKDEYCNVVFSMNGGSASRQIPAQSVKRGECVERPMDPIWMTVLNAKTFKGWYKESECINEFDFSEPVTGDTVIYAKWSSKYFVRFEMNGHGSGIPYQIVDSGEKAIEPDIPWDDVYTFGGWYIDRDFTIPFDFDTSIIRETVLYAKWLDIKSIAAAEITVGGEYSYTGAAHSPEDLIVTVGDDELLKGRDYVISGYRDNTLPGTATVIIEGRGNWKNSASGYFTINKGQLHREAGFTLEGNAAGAKLEDVEIKGGSVKNGEGIDVPGMWTWAEEDITSTIKNGQKYKAVFMPQSDSNLYSGLEDEVTVTWDEELTTPFYHKKTIMEYAGVAGSENNIIDLSDYIPDGASVTITEKVMNIIDSYSIDNRQLSVKLRGESTNSEMQFSSLQVNVSGCVEYADYYFSISFKYTDKTPQNEMKLTPNPMLLEYGDTGKVFSVTGTRENPEIRYYVAEGGAIVSVNKLSGEIYTSYPGYARVKATEAGNEEYAYTTCYAFVNVSRANINKAEFEFVSDSTFVYNGREIRPEIKGRFKGKDLEEGVDYYITYHNNTEAGEAKVRLIGTGKFKGYKDLAFTIDPIPLKLSEATLKNRFYVSNDNSVSIKSVVFKRGDNDSVFELKSISYNIAARMTDDRAGISKNVTFDIEMLDNNYAVTADESDARVTVFKSYLDDLSADAEGECGKTGSIDLNDKLVYGGTLRLYDYDDSDIFEGVPVVEGNILKYKIADNDENAGKLHPAAAVVRVGELENYNDYSISINIAIKQKITGPDDPLIPEDPVEPENQDVPHEDTVISVSENILDPIKTEKLPEGVSLITGKGKTIKLAVSGNNVKVKKWESSDKKIATVNKKGVVKAKASGSVTITATLKDGSKQEFRVCVEIPKLSKKIKITAYDDQFLAVSGNKIQFNITRFLEKDSNKYSEFSAFTSSSKKTATVDEKGVVTILKNGKSTITIKYGKTKIKTTLYVQFPDIKSSAISLASSGKSKKVSLSYCKDKTKVYTLESSDPKVFTVDNDKKKVTAVAKGEAELILKVNAVEYDRCKVIVKK